MDSPEPEVIPPKLAERWEKFGEAARACWAEVKAKELPAEKAFPAFWRCMEVKAHASKFYPDLTKEEAEKCRELGAPVEPHPICIMSKVAEGKSEDTAIRECLEEGKFHGISALACRARLKGVV